MSLTEDYLGPPDSDLFGSDNYPQWQRSRKKMDWSRAVARRTCAEPFIKTDKA